MELDEKRLELLELLIANKAEEAKQKSKEYMKQFLFYDDLLDKILDLDN